MVGARRAHDGTCSTRGQLRKQEDELEHRDDQCGRCQHESPPDAGHDRHDPSGQVDEHGDRVEDGERVVPVPGEQPHAGYQSQGSHHHPKNDGDPAGQRSIPASAGPLRVRGSGVGDAVSTSIVIG
jgi:hypothetical protein